MAATTGQLGFVTPTQGTLTGTWGDTVNNGITEYTNIAIAGTLTLTGDGAVTLANTTGDNSASNITSTLTGAGTVTAQFAIVRVTGTLTTTKVVTFGSVSLAPYSKTFTVVNAATGGAVTFKAYGQTGVSVAVGESAFVYYNGTDIVKVVGTATAGAAGGSTTQVQYNSSGVLAGSANMTFNGTTLTVNDLTDSSLTAGRVTYAGASGNLVDSANLTFDGTNLTVGGSATATRFIPSGSTVATNGMYLPAADTLGFSTASTERMRISSTGGVGIGATTLTQFGLRVSKTITGNIASYGIRSDGVVQSDVTLQAFNFNSTTSTAASSFTLGQMIHYSATQSTIGAGSTVTNQYGYLAESTLTGATNNYGFFGNIASGTGRYNLYMAGTADNYMAGNLVMGQTLATGVGVSTGSATFELGGNRTGDGASYIDFHSSASTDYEGRIIRGSGANGAFQFLNNGTGDFQLQAVNAAPITFLTGAVERMRISATGAVGIGTSSPTNPFEVNGTSRFFVSGQGDITIAHSSLISTIQAASSVGLALGAGGSERLRIASNGAFGLSGANYGTSGQVLTSGGSSAAPTWTTVGGGSAATPTALGTVYGSQTSGSGSPYLTAYGYWAANSNTGAGNTALGWAGLYVNTSGADNTSVGMQSMVANTTGSSNVAVGKQALQANTTASFNTAVGYQSGYTNTTGSNNSFFGLYAGYGNTTGSYNTAIGRVSFFTNTTGEYNTAIGTEALRSNTTASSNTAIGYGSLNSSTTAGSNTAVGAYAGNNTTTGDEQVIIGYAAGQYVTTGYQNVIIGNNACNSSTSGLRLTTGYKNTVIGQGAVTANNSDYRSVVIGWSATGKGTQTAYIWCNGSTYNSNNSAVWDTISDQRLKKNIVDNNIGLEKLTQIKIRNFEYRLPEEITEVPKDQAIQNTGIQIGVIAQELQAVLPDCVKQESTGVLRVNTDNLTWYMINAIKELKAEFDAYKLTHP